MIKHVKDIKKKGLECDDVNQEEILEDASSINDREEGEDVIGDLPAAEGDNPE